MMAATAAVLTVLFLLHVAASDAASNKRLPPSFKTCKQTNPNFNECLRQAIQHAVPALKKGIPSLGVPSIDPMPFASMKILQENKDRPVAVNLEMDNLLVYDMSRGTVETAEMVPGSYRVKAHLKSDYPIYMIGKYKVSGKVLILPVIGNGAINITVEGLQADLEMSGEPLEKGGQVYFDIKNFTVKMDLAKIHVHLENLFNGDKILGENMNKFLNENADILSDELKPAIEMALAATDMDVARKIFNKVPYNAIFPPS